MIAGRSADEHLKTLEKVLGDLHPHAILDVGMGCGFYGRWLRDKGFTGRLTGIEVWGPYISRLEFDPLNPYNLIHTCDIGSITFFPISDVTLAFDVLEHMPEASAISTLRRLQESTRIAVLVSVPVVPCPQGPIEGNPHEKHLKDWTSAEMLALGGKMLHRGAITGLFYFPHDYNDNYYKEIPSGEREREVHRPRFVKSRYGD